MRKKFESHCCKGSDVDDGIDDDDSRCVLLRWVSLSMMEAEVDDTTGTFRFAWHRCLAVNVAVVLLDRIAVTVIYDGPNGHVRFITLIIYGSIV